MFFFGSGEVCWANNHHFRSDSRFRLNVLFQQTLRRIWTHGRGFGMPLCVYIYISFFVGFWCLSCNSYHSSSSNGPGRWRERSSPKNGSLACLILERPKMLPSTRLCAIFCDPSFKLWFHTGLCFGKCLYAYRCEGHQNAFKFMMFMFMACESWKVK